MEAKFDIQNSEHHREDYANSVRVTWSVWDFLLAFGRMQQTSPEAIQIRNFQSIYLSPQQAKAFAMVLSDHVAKYESTFGQIKLDPRFVDCGAVN